MFYNQEKLYSHWNNSEILNIQESAHFLSEKSTSEEQGQYILENVEKEQENNGLQQKIEFYEGYLETQGGTQINPTY